MLLSLSAQRAHRNRNRDNGNPNRDSNSDYYGNGEEYKPSTNGGSNYDDGEEYNPNSGSNYDNGDNYNPSSHKGSHRNNGDNYNPSNNGGSGYYGGSGSGNAGGSTANPGNTGTVPTTTPTAPSTTGSGVTTSSDFITQALQYQNEFRTPLGLTPLTWSADLASGAASWAAEMASTDDLHHSRGPFGENIAYRSGSGPDVLQKLMAQFTNEKQYYINGCTFPDCTTGGDVGHYTQIVWRTTTQVGCGTSTVGGKTFLCCRYLPAGNMIGDKVY